MKNVDNFHSPIIIENTILNDFFQFTEQLQFRKHKIESHLSQFDSGLLVQIYTIFF